MINDAVQRHLFLTHSLLFLPRSSELAFQFVYLFGEPLIVFPRHLESMHAWLVRLADDEQAVHTMTETLTPNPNVLSAHVVLLFPLICNQVATPHLFAVISLHVLYQILESVFEFVIFFDAPLVLSLRVA